MIILRGAGSARGHARELARVLRRCDHVLPVCMHVTRAGTRFYRVFVGGDRGAVRSITACVAWACRLRLCDRDGQCMIVMGGSGYCAETAIAEAIGEAIGRKITIAA